MFKSRGMIAVDSAITHLLGEVRIASKQTVLPL